METLGCAPLGKPRFTWCRRRGSPRKWWGGARCFGHLGISQGFDGFDHAVHTGNPQAPRSFQGNFAKMVVVCGHDDDGVLHSLLS